MNLGEVIEHVVKRNGAGVIVDLLAESVSQPSKAPHVHPHREVLALDVASRNMRLIRMPRYGSFDRPEAGAGAVAALFPNAALAAIQLLQHGVVNVAAERALYGSQIRF